MKKKSTIISILIMAIITFTLLGLTYAYYRTRVIGNENPTSIKATVKKLEIVYNDGTSIMNMEGKIRPGFIALKNFNVENTGSESATYSIILENINNTYTRTTDWEYSLYEGKYEKIEDLNTAIDGGLAPISSSNINEKNYQVIKGSVEIPEAPEGERSIKYYTLKVEYKNLDEDQSDDMGAKLSFKVNITDEWFTWGEAPEGTLLYALKNNNNYVEPYNLGVTANTSKPGKTISTATEALLSSAEDDFGTSYYFRGNVTNNFVNFAGMCWRVMRVQGDGSIKLILEDQYAECNSDNYTGDWQIPFENATTKGNFGFTTTNSTIKNITYLNPGTDGARSMSVAFRYFQDSMEVSDLAMLSNNNWCFANNAYKEQNVSDESKLDEATILNYKTSATQFHYDSRVRLEYLQEPTFKCFGTTMTDWEDDKNTPMYVGGITANEYVYAGGKFSAVQNNSFYLLNSAFKNGNLSNKYFWTMSPYSFNGSIDRGMIIWSTGNLSHSGVGDHFAYRPSVLLKSNVLATTDTTSTEIAGTQNNPYIVG